MDAIGTIPYKGVKINIYQDEDAESPDNWGNKDVFLVAFHRDFWVQRDGFGKEVCIQLATGEEKGERAKEIEKEYHWFGLEAYIHGGVSLALSYEGNFVDRQWDVSQLGLVFVSKKEARSRKKAKEIAESLIETWNNYLSGQVYGYMIETGEGEQGGCWGFYGDWEKSGLLEEAKGEVDEIIREKTEKHVKKIKAMIRQGVSLEKREPLAI